jgi:ABC-type branched-subunit amino acid transport system substrate-binding protein
MKTLLLALVAVLTLSACDIGSLPSRDGRANPAPQPTSQETRVIGLVGTFSGPQAWKGEDAFEGADLGVHALNRSRTPGEPPYELVHLDDGGDIAKAVTLIEQLAAFQQTVGIIYAGAPAGLADAERALARSGIPGMLCYGDLYSSRRLRPHLFQMSPPVLWQARRLVSYLVEDRDYRRLGVLASRSTTGFAAAASLKDALRDEGGARLAVAHYEDDLAIRRALERLRDRRVESVVIEGSPNEVTAALKELKRMGAAYRTTPGARIASAAPGVRARRAPSTYWHPQVAAFDLAIAPRVSRRRGTVAAETYARGAHYLPIPSFQRFTLAFRGWWDSTPLGWQRRAYEAVRAVGWAADRAAPGQDLAKALESLRSERFGGLPITFGPDDHTAVGESTIGLWVAPRGEPPILKGSLSWTMLARGFSIDGERTNVLPADWRYLFRNPPPKRAPAPRIQKMRFAVTSSADDPIH